MNFRAIKTPTNRQGRRHENQISDNVIYSVYVFVMSVNILLLLSAGFADTVEADQSCKSRVKGRK